MEVDGEPGKCGACLPKVRRQTGIQARACSQMPNSFSFCDTKHLRPVKEIGSTDLGGGLAERVRKNEAQR